MTLQGTHKKNYKKKKRNKKKKLFGENPQKGNKGKKGKAEEEEEGEGKGGFMTVIRHSIVNVHPPSQLKQKEKEMTVPGALVTRSNGARKGRREKQINLKRAVDRCLQQHNNVFK